MSVLLFRRCEKKQLIIKIIKHSVLIHDKLDQRLPSLQKTYRKYQPKIWFL